MLNAGLTAAVEATASFTLPLFAGVNNEEKLRCRLLCTRHDYQRTGKLHFSSTTLIKCKFCFSPSKHWSYTELTERWILNIFSRQPGSPPQIKHGRICLLSCGVLLAYFLLVDSGYTPPRRPYVCLRCGSCHLDDVRLGSTDVSDVQSAVTIGTRCWQPSCTSVSVSATCTQVWAA